MVVLSVRRLRYANWSPKPKVRYRYTERSGEFRKFTIGFMSMGSGWSGNRYGVSQAPRAVSVKMGKIKAGITPLRNATGLCVAATRNFLLSPTKSIPKNGVNVRLAQNAKRSYVSHSQEFPKKRRGSGVVPPRPRRKRTTKEMNKPMNRGCQFRKRKGIKINRGPYIGKKKTASASGSVKKLCRERWSMGVCMICCAPHC